MNSRGRLRAFLALTCAASIAGCANTGGLGDVARAPFSFFQDDVPQAVQASAPAPQAALDANLQDGTQSSLIEGLLNRRSVLGDGPYQQVSNAVLATNTRAAEADLRAAMLRSEAEALNWLPTLGPTVSLTSLGDVMTQLVVDQVLFDNGRKKAERDYAQADVEVAAVALAEESNQRVHTALDLYIDAQEATAQAAVNDAAMDQMNRYAYVMEERVKGGVSNRVDMQIVVQKRNEMQSDMSSDYEAAARAMAELNTMTATPMDGLIGLSDVGASGPGAQPLPVMKAQAEAHRAAAEAAAARAGVLPQLTAGGSVGSSAARGGLNLGGGQGFGLGTGAAREAAAESGAAAQARVGQVQEDANRRLAGMRAELASLQRQAVQTQTLADQADANFRVFAEQQRSGHRSVPEVVGIFETKVRTARTATAMKYDVARMELRIAAMMGSLVNGEQI